MNQVDIYIGDYRLDLFQDEDITINLNVQNIKDLSKVFTDFTQTFTIPASGYNNEVLGQYYRTDVESSRITTSRTISGQTLFNGYNARVLTAGGVVEAGACCISALDALGGSYTSTSTANSFDFRLRPSARIEINSLPFRTGVVQLESVQLKGTEPYAYSLSFYGDLVNLTDLFGEDYLYDLDLSAYDHTYDGATIQSGFDQEALFSGDVFYPLMSPVRNWVYNVSSSSDPRHEDDIQYVTGHTGHHHGVKYNEVKPAIKVVKLIDAIESKYGITFGGSFITSSPFDQLYLWAHRFEGYLYDSSTTIDWQLINMNRNTGSGSQFNLATDTWTVETTVEYQLRVQVLGASANYELGLFVNGELLGLGREDANAGTNTTFFDGYIFNDGDEVQLKIRPQIATNMTYQVTDYTAYDINPSTGLPVTQQFEVDQTASATYSFQLAMSPLMPEIKVADFLAGIIKMHNLVILPTSSTNFNLYTLDEYYSSGTETDFQKYLDIDSMEVKRPPLYRRIAFDYQPTDQILGFEYRNTNIVGYGDLNQDFIFDGEEYGVTLPFECPLFELLTDIDAGTLSNILVYKSQTRNPDTSAENRFQKYRGAPILFYGEFGLDISANPISFVDEADAETQVNEVWYANTSSTFAGTGDAKTLTFGSDIDPYYLVSIGASLYAEYYEDYLTDLYNSKKRIINVSAQLPLGAMINLSLNDLLIFNNVKYKINSATISLTSGKAQLELLNEV
jgi:hypothetical protein